MNFTFVEGFLGRLVAAYGLVMLIPLFTALLLFEPERMPWLISIFLTIGIGTLMAVHGGKNSKNGKLGIREGFAIVGGAWILTTVFGAIPFWLSQATPTYIDALFETASGLTTTGASVINDLEILSKSILLWRSITHWLGGMGIIVLFIIFLPRIGIGAINLFKAEVPGPTAEKVLPRIKDTALTLWMIYAGLTALETLLLIIFGMSPFDALNHSFATLATGGFSTKNASIKYYDSLAIELIIVTFMILAGINFSLYIEGIRKGFAKAFRDLELKIYLGILTVATLLISLTLVLANGNSFGSSLRMALFQVVSITTTTGFVTANYEEWSPLAKMILFFLMFMGGSAGSTAGGIKVSRLILLVKLGWLELRRVIHPRLILNIKIGGHPVSPEVLVAVPRFFFLFILTFVLASLAMTAVGLEPFDAMAAVIATLGNIGPGFGIVGPTTTYAALPLLGKVILTFTMLLGRLELFTLLVLLQPEFWRNRKNW